jgi:hypothetical protein
MPSQIQRTDTFSKCLKDLDAIAFKNFEREAKDLERSNDPTTFAEFVPTRNYGRCWVRRLTKSYRLAYRVYADGRIIQLITTGDHKKIFGRDKHS